MVRTLLILFVLAALHPSRTVAQEVDVLATIDGDVVHADAFANRYLDYLLRTGAEDDARLRSAMLEQIINERLIAADGHARGLAGTDRFRHFQQSARQKLLVESFLETEVRAGVQVTEADLEDAFIRINTEIAARHLYARTQAEAELLYRRLQDGETFESLAGEVFADTSLANNGGSIGTFTFDELDPDFEDAAFSLAVGETSRPVRTAQGYSIIQVTDRFTKPILTETEYAERKGKLAPFVLRKKRAMAQSHFVRERADALNAVFGGGFDRLFAQLTGVSLVQDEEMKAFLSEDLVTFDDGGTRTTWTLADFRRRASFTDEAHRSQVRTDVDLKEFITGLVVREQIVSAAEALDLQETPEYRAALESAVDEWVLERRREQLAAEIEISEDSIRAHFDRHPGEFRGENGRPMPYEQARPRIVEQLRHTYTRDTAASYIAGLRRAAAIEKDRAALLALKIGGRSFPAQQGSLQHEATGAIEGGSPSAPVQGDRPSSNNPVPADIK